MEQTLKEKDEEKLTKYIFYVRKSNYLFIFIFLSTIFSFEFIDYIKGKKKKSYLYICPFKECKRKFKYRNNLMTHVRTHYKIKPFICTFCSKSFNEKGNLKTHERIHTGERPYQCKECSKNFKTFGQLKDHILSHTDYKPFQCPYCFKNYRRKGILKHHMKIHLKDPQYFAKKNFYESHFQHMKLTSLFIKYLMKKYMSNLNKKKKGKKGNKIIEIKEKKEINEIVNNNGKEDHKKDINIKSESKFSKQSIDINNNVYSLNNLINNIYIKNILDNNNMYNKIANTFQIYNFNTYNFINKNNFFINSINNNNNYNY